jgi:hypothetical protein
MIFESFYGLQFLYICTLKLETDFFQSNHKQSHD